MVKDSRELYYWDTFEKAGVITFGHFEFASGRHCDEKIDFELIAKDEVACEIACRGFARVIAGLRSEQPFSAVVSVAEGANHFLDRTVEIASYALGYDLSPIKTAYRGQKPNREFYWPESESKKIDASLGEGKVAVVLEDVINRFTNSGAVTRLIQATGAEVTHIVAGVSRTGLATSPEGVPATTLVTKLSADWKQEDCYLCPDTPLDINFTRKQIEQLRRQA